MGNCNRCCNNGQEEMNEMLDGNFPEQNISINKKDDIILKESNLNREAEENNSKNIREDANNNNQQKNETEESLDSEMITINHERTDFLFDFFNDIRVNPDKYINESREYGLERLLQAAADTAEKPNNLIKNGFFNLLLDSFINRTPTEEGEIFNSIDRETKLLNFNKKLYIVEAPVNKVEEAVWNLLKSKEETALQNILLKKIDYCVLSTVPSEGTANIKAYFLFLNNAGH